MSIFCHSLVRPARQVRARPTGSTAEEALVLCLSHFHAERGWTYSVDSEGNVVKTRLSVVSLNLLRRSNEAHMQPLYALLRQLPSFIHAYLQEFVFPPYMRHKRSKISASGQELGGSILFGRRIGFSGTPSDLLPVDLGSCGFAEEDEGLILHTLSSPEIVSLQNVTQKTWSVESLLQRIASNTTPVFNALIDTGALITGMANVDVARFLLRNGLSQRGIEGVVYLDERDRKMVYVGVSNNSVKLEECGIAKEQRFAFYDHVHTTGTDIQHAINATAALTLGKDMTYRDYAQGAYRMRGISKGQTIVLFVIPEVAELIQRELAKCGATTLPPIHAALAWLVINSMRSERIQFNLLQIQNAANVWRKAALSQLLESSSQLCSLGDVGNLQQHLDTFQEDVDFSVCKEVVKSVTPYASLVQMIATKGALVTDPTQRALLDHIQGQLRDVTASDVSTKEYESEASQQYDQEQQQQQEQEQEQEQEIEIEKFMDLAYSRSEEAPTPWALTDLRAEQPPMFYAANKFVLCRRRALEFPNFLALSSNYFNPKWSGWRRLKNVVCMVDVIPGAVVADLDSPHGLPLSEDLQKVAKDIVSRMWSLFTPRGAKMSDEAMGDLLNAYFAVDKEDDDEAPVLRAVRALLIGKNPSLAAVINALLSPTARQVP